VQRPRRVGAHIFDVDPLVRANRREAVLFTFADNRPKFVAPGVGLEADVDEAWSGDLDRGDRRKCFELGLDRLG